MRSLHYLIILLLFATSVVVTACGGPSPEDAYADAVQAAEEGDWDAVYESFDLRSQARIDVGMEMLRGLGTAFGDEDDPEIVELKELSGRELFIRMAESQDQASELVDTGDYQILETRRDGDRAELDVRRGDRVDTIVMVLEDGAWKQSADFGESASDGESESSGADSADGSDEDSDGEALDLAALEAESTREAQLQEIRDAFSATVTGLELLPENYDIGRYTEQFQIDMAYANNTDKDISGAKGVVVFSDMFDDEIMRIDVSHDEGLAAGESTTWIGGVDYNQFMDSHKKLASTPLDKMTVEWEPEVVIFDDGTRLTAPGAE